MTTLSSLRSGLAMLAIGTAAMLTAANAAAPESRTPFPFSADPAVSARQHAAYDVVHRYEQLLNASDTAGILDLCAPESPSSRGARNPAKSRSSRQRNCGAAKLPVFPLSDSGIMRKNRIESRFFEEILFI
jgi:hypothetical protein